jgi:pimeloyl-ACP methyl ester carboxylesterase
MKLVLRVCVGVAASVLLWEFARAARTAWYEYHVFHPVRREIRMPVGAHERGLRDVTFDGAGGTRVHGWYLASRTGSAVVLAAGSESDRSAMWRYAELLSADGHGVLTFDWPGNGASEGAVTMGEPERLALHGAISFVLAQPDVYDGRVGVLGFSLGSYIAVLEAAQDPRVRVLVLEGLFDNPWRQTKLEYLRAGTAAQLGGMLGDYLAGLRPDAPRSSALLPRLAGVSLVLVAGESDRTVPIGSTRALYELAAEPKQFWAIRGAVHGGYLDADPGYATRLRALFARALAAMPHDSTAAH